MVSELDTRRCTNENVGPKGGLIVRSHIDWKEEQVSVRTLGPKGGLIVRSHIDWKEEEVSVRTLDPKGGGL